eukprot:Gb_28294 [translate_table: standard]
MSTSCARRMMTNSGCLCDSRMEFGLSSAKHKFCSSLSLNAAFSNKRVFDEVNMSVRKTLPLLGDVDSAKKPMSQYTHSVVFKPKIRLGRSQGVPAQAASGAEVGFEDSSIELSPYQSKVLEFITSERAKVIAMVALGMSLCNADRVVLSVAIVPLASTNGWNSYFSGIVQVASGEEVGFEDSSIELSPYQSKVLEFITSERAKVVAMEALGMSLCNTDRVVPSVAIVPLASTNGWNNYFSSIVQVSFLSNLNNNDRY